MAPGIDGIYGRGDAGYKLGFGGPFMWVNEDGDRFVAEDIAGENNMAVYIPGVIQRNFYGVIDASLYEALLCGPRVESAITNVDAVEEFEAALANPPSNNLFKADTLEELAEKIGMKPETLVSSVERYNSLCEKGRDADFGKDPSCLVPLTTAPYYMFRMDPCVLVAIGGLGTNRDMQVIDAENQPIPGLYATGVDGVRLYRKVYPINVPGTACANNVNSARRAIRHIAENR